MTDFYSETVKRLMDLEKRMLKQEARVPDPNLWLKRAKQIAVVLNTFDGRGVGYVALDPTPAVTDLNSITNGFNGQVMVLRTYGAAGVDIVTVKDAVGNISLPVSGDIVLDDPEKAIMLLYDSHLGVSGLWIGFCCP